VVSWVTHAPTLIDTVVVPAVGAVYDQMPVMLTIDMQIRYLSAARCTDLVAEGWIVKRGRSIVFCQAEVVADPTGDVVAEGWLTYRVVVP
jgi:acyl-coenzyme A thioesterase PaaI-like protein